MFAFFLMVVGIVLLVFGGNWTIDGAANIARKLGISPLLVGFTVIAFGTSLPELLVSVQANWNGFPGISLGNVVGSNIANILLVIGMTAIVYPLTSKRDEVKWDVVMMIASTGLLLCFIILGGILQIAGLIMIAILIIYIVIKYRAEKRAGNDGTEELEEVSEINSMGKAAIYAIGGLLAVAVGSELLVRGAVDLATRLGVSEAVIGLTIVALGTSLPELTTCVAGAVKKETGMVVGNIVGSNVFNVLFILGATASIKPLPIDITNVSFDMWLMAAATVVFAFQLMEKQKVSRFAGGVYCSLYVFLMAKHFIF